MTDASNPAAELTEAERWNVILELGGCPFTEDVDDGSMCTCGLPALGHDEAVERIVLADHPHVASLLARLAAGGAATDGGLRARVEALAADFDRRWATMSVREVAAALHALADAAPAPTEDATCGERFRVMARNAPPYFCDKPKGHPGGHGTGYTAQSRAADAAAEEPRTEAQTAVKVLQDAEDALDLSEFYDPSMTGGISEECAKAESAAMRWLRDRADRLSRADEEAGS